MDYIQHSLIHLIAWGKVRQCKPELCDIHYWTENKHSQFELRYSIKQNAELQFKFECEEKNLQLFLKNS